MLSMQSVAMPLTGLKEGMGMLLLGMTLLRPVGGGGCERVGYWASGCL